MHLPSQEFETCRTHHTLALKNIGLPLSLARLLSIVDVNCLTYNLFKVWEMIIATCHQFFNIGKITEILAFSVAPQTPLSRP